MLGRICLLGAAAVLGVSCSAAQPKITSPAATLSISKPEASVSSVQGFRTLAEQGQAEAQFNLGRSYEYGRGVPKDSAEALRWYRLAAGQGDAFAQFDLGNHYSEGIGVSKSEKEAVRWWQLAAAQGFPPAQHSLGKMLATGGEGVPPDKIQSYIWLALSSAQGNDEARQERDAIAKQLTPAQAAKAKQMVNQWKPVRAGAVVTRNSK